MRPTRQQDKRPEPRVRAAAVQRATGPAPSSPSPRYGFASVSPRFELAGGPHAQMPAPRPNGLPEPLKTNMETMSGLALDDVRVHRNSSRPAALGALAYAQGGEIHVAPGQEEHLPHEAWHVVQQKQGRVKATRQMKGVDLNDSSALEAEADAMGARALRGDHAPREGLQRRSTAGRVCQPKAGIEFETQLEARSGAPVAVPQGPPNALQQPLHDIANRVPQDELMASQNGWTVVSDNSALEFVTQPPVETAALGAVIDDMVQTLLAIQTPIAASADFEATIGVAPTGGKQYYIMPYSRNLVSGQMQGSVGIPFAKLPAFFQLLTQYELTAANARQAFLAQRWQHNPTQKQQEMLVKVGKDKKAVSDKRVASIATIIGHVNQRTQPMTQRLPQMPANARATETEQLNKLKGLLILVGQYLMFAKGYESSYAKKRFPVMARTSFSSMYEALSKGYQRHFYAEAAGLAGDLELGLDDQVFGANAAKLGASATFTVKEWLKSIEAAEKLFVPSDRAQTDEEAEYDLAPMDEIRGDRMSYPGRDAKAATDASMGRMGLDQGKVVVELRGLRNDHTPDSIRAFVNDLATLEQA